MNYSLNRNKKGFSLVEVIAALLILSVVAGVVLLGLSLSQKVVHGNTREDAYGAEAQAAADVIMTYVNGEADTGEAIEAASGGLFLFADNSTDGGFYPGDDKVQFQIGPEPGGSGLYKITIRRYYGPDSGREYVEMVCYAHKGW